MDFKKIVPHLIAIGVIFAVTAIFFAPNVFSGKVLPQPDNDKARGMQTEIQAYLKSEGKTPLWTNSAFGGMPSYQIFSPVKSNLTAPVFDALLLGTDMTASPWAQVLLAMLTAYLLLNVLGADWRVAVFGALGYGITSYNVDILEAGHTTKMIALALMPGVLAGLVLTFNGKYLLGGGLMALFMAMQIYANHVQITYYTLIISGIYFLAMLVEAIRNNNVANWGKALATSALAIVLGFASNTANLACTYEYSKETIRGKSELSKNSNKGDGLDKDYLFGWSYGKAESLTLLVPHFAGGGAGENYKGARLMNALDPQFRGQVKGLFYTGDQPFVGTAIYFGAIVFFLFFLGAWLVPGGVKYWLVAGGLFMISLAWGKNFFLNFVWYDYLPMFNKFRAVSMALGIGQFCFAMLAALGLQKLTDPGIDVARKKKALYVAAGITGFLCLLAMMLGSTSGPNDQALQQDARLLQLLQEDRASMLRMDVLRSVAFAGGAAWLIWLYLQGYLKAALTVVLIGLGSLADHWLVCTRTLTPDKYETKRTALAPPQEQDFDKQIKQDPDPHYRVLDLARGSITGNAQTSYFHKSLSGYHAAKLGRFQEVVDEYLTGDALGKNLHIVGMMNGKYIVTPNGEVMRNPEVCGNAWFVKHFDIVPTADAELAALGNLNPKDSAVVQQAFAGTLEGFRLQPDSAATIRLSKYHPTKMEYEYSAATDQLAVFSEIYYPPAKGWKCYLNDQPAPDFFKVNYLLRGMRLPAGQNMRLEMRFEPECFSMGEKVAYGASGLLLLLFLGGLFMWYRRHPLDDPNRLSDMPAREQERPATKTAKPAPRKKK